MFDMVHSYRVMINPYSAKSLGDRLYATLHKMPGKIGYSFCFLFFFFEILKLSPRHIWQLRRLIRYVRVLLNHVARYRKHFKTTVNLRFFIKFS